MGSGASVPDVGVPVNPRLQYADERAKKDGKAVVIDAPTLLDLGHGTIRYRYIKNKEQPSSDTNVRQSSKDNEKVTKRVEQPHEIQHYSSKTPVVSGSNLPSDQNNKMKHGYFYHARLNDFSEDADVKREEAYKFNYVFQGPTRAKKKKLYYVFGTGLDAKDTKPILRNESVKTQGKGYVWPTDYRQTNHIYYEMIFSKQREEIPEDEDDDIPEEFTQKKSSHKHITFKMKQKDTIHQLKERLSIRLLKPIDHIHVIFQRQDLGSEVEIGEKRSTLGLDEGTWKRVDVKLNEA